MPNGARSGTATTLSMGGLARPPCLSRLQKSPGNAFFSPAEPVHAFVAEEHGHVVGLVHYLFHRSTNRLHDVCYLQDLFTAQPLRGKVIGRLMIQAVYQAARAGGSSRVYWTTQVTNHAGRALYDKVAQHMGFIIYSHEL